MAVARVDQHNRTVLHKLAASAIDEQVTPRSLPVDLFGFVAANAPAGGSCLISCHQQLQRHLSISSTVAQLRDDVLNSFIVTCRLRFCLAANYRNLTT